MEILISIKYKSNIVERTVTLARADHWSNLGTVSSFNNVTLVFDDDKTFQAYKVFQPLFSHVTIIIENYCIIYRCAMKSNLLIVFKFHLLQIIKIIFVCCVDVNFGYLIRTQPR